MQDPDEVTQPEVQKLIPRPVDGCPVPNVSSDRSPPAARSSRSPATPRPPAASRTRCMSGRVRGVPTTGPAEPRPPRNIVTTKTTFGAKPGRRDTAIESVKPKNSRSRSCPDPTVMPLIASRSKDSHGSTAVQDHVHSRWSWRENQATRYPSVSSAAAELAVVNEEITSWDDFPDRQHYLPLISSGKLRCLSKAKRERSQPSPPRTAILYF